MVFESHDHGIRRTRHRITIDQVELYAADLSLMTCLRGQDFESNGKPDSVGFCRRVSGGRRHRGRRCLQSMLAEQILERRAF